MSEHERGAYTPQPDAPLQFDARGPRARRPMPMTLIGSGAVLLVLLGALALHYRHDTKPEAPRPVGEPVAQLKTAAPADAQPKDPAAGIDVFGGAAKTATAPNFAPPPEAPKPRAQLTVQAVEPLPVKSAPIATTASAATTTPAPISTPTSVAKAAAKPVPTYKAPSTDALAKPDATAVVAKVAATPVETPAVQKTSVAKASPSPAATLKTAAAKPTATTATTPAATKTTSGGAAAVVQIGAYSSPALSDKGFSDVSAAMAGEMAGKSKRVEALDKGGKTLYRTSVAGFSSRAAADAFCKSLAAKGKICFVKS